MKLLKDNIYNLIGNITYALSQSLVIIILNKLGNPIDVGAFTYGMAVIIPFFILAQGGLRSIISIDAKNNYNFNIYFYLRLICCVIALLLVALINISNKYFTIIILLATFKFMDSIFDIYYGQYQRDSNFKSIYKSKVIRSISNILSFTVTYYFTKNLIFSLIIYTLSSLIIYLIYDFRVYKINIKNLKHSILFKVFIISLPLAISSFLISLNTNIPRILLENKVGIITLGAFGSFIYLLNICQIVVQSICQVFSPRLAKYYLDSNYSAFKRNSFLLIFLILLISIIFVLFAIFLQDIIFYLLFNSSFYKYKNIYEYIIYISPIIFLGVALGNICTAQRKIKIQPYIFLVITIINLTSVYFTISLYGIYGAIFSLLLVALLTCVFLTFYIKFYKR